MTSARSTTYSGRYEDKYPWAAADSTDPGSARCHWCNRSFKINSMGRGAFESHQKSKGHQREISIRRTNLQIENFSTLTTPASNEGNYINKSSCFSASLFLNQCTDSILDIFYKNVAAEKSPY